MTLVPLRPNPALSRMAKTIHAHVRQSRNGSFYATLTIGNVTYSVQFDQVAERWHVYYPWPSKKQSHKVFRNEEQLNEFFEERKNAIS